MDFKSRIKKWFWLFAAGSLIGFYSAGNEFLVCPKDNICSLAGEKLELRGKIVSWPSQRLEKTFVEVEIESDSFSQNKTGRLLLILAHSNYRLDYLSRIRFKGKIKIPEEDNESNFSYPLFLAGKNIFVFVQEPEIIDYSFDKNNLSRSESVLAHLASWRETMKKQINFSIREPEASVIKAMVLGDQGEIPDSVRSPLSRSGLVHILSISGSHVTFLILIFSAIFSRLGIRPLFSLVFNLLLVGFYLLLSGAPACAERAGLMGMMTIFFIYFGVLPNPFFIFWFSFLILTIQNPLAPVADIGFQLSYLAVFSMLFIFPYLNKLIFWGRSGRLVGLGSAAVFGLTVGIFTTPLAAFYFGTVPWIAPLANLVLAPLISLLLPWGLIFIFGNTLIGLSSLSARGFDEILIYPLHLFWQLIFWINERLLEIPISFSEKRISPWMLFAIYLVLMLLNFIFRKYVFYSLLLIKIKKFSDPEYWESKRNKIGNSRFFRFRKNIFSVLFYCERQKIIGLCLLPIMAISVFSLAYFWETGQSPNVAFLDVDQGDAILINYPGDGFQILVDGGPGRKILSALDKEMPFFDRKIEFVFLTHYHQDHLEGLIAVFEKYKVENLVVPYLKTGAPYSLEKIFADRVAATDLKIILARRGQELIFSGPSEKYPLRLKILAPSLDFAQNKIFDLNDESVIIKMFEPRSLLLTGDATLRTEKILLLKNREELKSDYLKVGHHGSRFATGEEFLKAVEPKEAIISVGKKNMYGHPTKATLGRLEQKSVRIKRTDMLGTVRLLL